MEYAPDPGLSDLVLYENKFGAYSIKYKIKFRVLALKLFFMYCAQDSRRTKCYSAEMKSISDRPGLPV